MERINAKSILRVIIPQKKKIIVFRTYVLEISFVLQIIDTPQNNYIYNIKFSFSNDCLDNNQDLNYRENI